MDKRLVVAAALLIAGLAVYFPGLGTPFQGDDLTQIVNNPTVHSIGNFPLFFTGGTFYTGQGVAGLGGVYYRPLVSTNFSLIYSLFGANPAAFHVIQLLLCIANAFILYLVLRRFMDDLLASVLALVFLIHPGNSQVVYSIAYLQDALFFFFGSLGLWLVVRFHSNHALLGAVCLLVFSLFSKETGIFFVLMALVYLGWQNRTRVLPFVTMTALPIAVYVAAKSVATGVNTNPNNAPIDNLDLIQRLLTAPSAVLFYIEKTIFPLQLASAYYWVDTGFSITGVLLPLLADICVLAVVVAVAMAVRKRGNRGQYSAYLFFAFWTMVGIGAHAQIIALDMTASEPWLYFPVAGMLGMAGVVISVIAPRMHLKTPLVIATVGLIVLSFGVRSGLRGLDWHDPLTLARADLAASPDDFNAYIPVALHAAQQGRLKEAEGYAMHSLNIYPTIEGYNSLGLILFAEGNWQDARRTFLNGIGFIQNHGLPISFQLTVYENLGTLAIWYGDPAENIAFLISATQSFPEDGKLWLDLAIVEQRAHHNGEARTALGNAYRDGISDPYVLAQVTSNAPITLPPSPSICFEGPACG